MFEQYWEEYAGFETRKSEFGFLIFKLYGDKTIYLRDFYILPKFRRSRKAWKMADDLFDEGRIRGATRVFTSIDLTVKKNSDGLKAALAYGFEVSHAEGQVLWLEKGI